MRGEEYRKKRNVRDEKGEEVKERRERKKKKKGKKRGVLLWCPFLLYTNSI